MDKPPECGGRRMKPVHNTVNRLWAPPPTAVLRFNENASYPLHKPLIHNKETVRKRCTTWYTSFVQFLIQCSIVELLHRWRPRKNFPVGTFLRWLYVMCLRFSAARCTTSATRFW